MLKNKAKNIYIYSEHHSFYVTFNKTTYNTHVALTQVNLLYNFLLLQYIKIPSYKKSIYRFGSEHGWSESVDPTVSTNILETTLLFVFNIYCYHISVPLYMWLPCSL